ncbi:MAG: hypothetical protein LUB61_04255 [Eggerthellaceae bacterium]|nr:hypothetical protein [Eggerthellaceae bacterium]
MPDGTEYESAADLVVETLENIESDLMDHNNYSKEKNILCIDQEKPNPVKI